MHPMMQLLEAVRRIPVSWLMHTDICTLMHFTVSEAIQDRMYGRG